MITTVTILTIAGLIQGFFGFGYAAFALPLLVITMSTQDAVGTIVAIAPLTNFISIVMQHKEIEYRSTLPLAFGTLLFFPVGAWLLFTAPEWSLHLALGIIILFSLLPVLSPRFSIPSGKISGAAASAFSGLFGGAIGVPGLTMTAYIYSKEPDSHKARASLQFFFMFTTAIGVITHGFAGTITRDVLITMGAASVPTALTLSAGIAAAKKTKISHLKKIYAAGLGILGVYTIIKTIVL